MIDRSGCAARKHGTYSAYQNQKCRCPDAKVAQRTYVKRRKLARHRGASGRAGMVPSWRAVRRFQALARIGYSGRQVQAAAWGYDRNHGTMSFAAVPRMGPERFARLDAVYQRWSGVPGTNQRAVAWARARNYPAPLDWDNIDDPNEVPHNHTPEGLAQRARQKEAAA